jgi:cysteine desulfurase
MLGLSDKKIVFLSSATEANNLAIRGFLKGKKEKKGHIITTRIEHASILNVFKELEEEGYSVTYLPVNENHQIDLEVFEKSLQNDTILVSIMVVNNETGSILNLKDIYKICKDRKIIMHSDFAQGFLKTENDLLKCCDMFTISSHKIHGLKSVAALVMNKNINMMPILAGGAQEYGIRSSTVDVPLIASFYKAIEMNFKDKNKKYPGIAEIFDYCVQKIKSIPYLILNTKEENTTKYIVNFSFKENIKAAIVLEYLSKKEIYVSTTSACNSKGEKMSYVIYEIYKDESRAHNMLRLSFDENNTKEEIDTVFNEIDNCVKGTLWKI